jgi:two-component system sensor histidine kinase YesM
MKAKITFPLYSQLMLFFIASLSAVLLVYFFLNQALLNELSEQRASRINSVIAECQEVMEQEVERAFLNSNLFIMNEYSAYLLSQEYDSMNAYKLGKIVSEIHNDLIRIKFSSDFISKAALYLPVINRTISTENYYDEAPPEILQNISIEELVYDRLNWIEAAPVFVFRSPLGNRQTCIYILIIEIDRLSLSRHLARYSTETTMALVTDKQQILPSHANNEPIEPAAEPPMEPPPIPAVDLIPMPPPSDNTKTKNYMKNSTVLQYRFSPVMQSWFVSISSRRPYQTIYNYQGAQIFILLITIVFSINIAQYIIRRIRHPFQKLLWLFEEVEKGDFDIRIEYDRKDEFAIVFEELGKMLRRIKLLIADKLFNEKELHKAELRLFEAQINPHFIYNSFNILRQAIHIEELDTAKILAGKLCDYFRYITYNEEDMLPLSLEYRFACDYLEIQKIRFQGRINIQISPLDKKYHDIKVPRMILQPLVENAFKHGIQNMELNGKICLYSEADEAVLRIVVQDNGQGLSKEGLEYLRASLIDKNLPGSHLGLVNIYRRLRAVFPESRLEFAAPEGFISTIVIPLIKDKKDV